MIAGLGIDIIGYDRIKKSISEIGTDFLTRIFSEEEISYCSDKINSHENFAARFAAKEALFKAFGTGLRGSLCWTDVVIKNIDNGAPAIELHGGSKEMADKLGIVNIFVSLTHADGYAVAVVILEK